MQSPFYVRWPESGQRFFAFRKLKTGKISLPFLGVFSYKKQFIFCAF